MQSCVCTCAREIVIKYEEFKIEKCIAIDEPEALFRIIFFFFANCCVGSYLNEIVLIPTIHRFFFHQSKIRIHCRWFDFFFRRVIDRRVNLRFHLFFSISLFFFLFCLLGTWKTKKNWLNLTIHSIKPAANRKIMVHKTQAYKRRSNVITSNFGFACTVRSFYTTK